MTEDVDVLYSEARTRRVRVVYDEGGYGEESPVNSGDGFEAVVPSRARFTVGGEATFQREFDEFDSRGMAGAFPRWLRIFHGIDAVLLYRYEHSLVAYSVASFLGRAQHASWDSGPCGFMYYNADDRTEWWAGKSEEERLETFESVAESLTDWSNGWYYGLVEERLRTGTKVYADGAEDEDFEEWEEVDSVYGILGRRGAEAEARSWIDACAHG